MIATKKSPAMLTFLLISVLLSTPHPTPGQAGAPRTKNYPLNTWSNITCRAKGRFQDRDYCSSAVMDQIVADGKSAIPVLISQISDTRWIADAVDDCRPRHMAGVMAY